MMKTTLSKLDRGSTATIIAMDGETRITKRLMEMGVVPGISVKMIKSAPFGDPMEIRVRGYSLALRKSEADAVTIAFE